MLPAARNPAPRTGRMIRNVSTVIAVVFMVGGTAWAQDKQTAQQERMKSCNAQASKDKLKGDERKAFMSDCLRADSGRERALTAQQQKMKTCNVEASKRGLRSDERKAFMSRCLKAEGAAGGSASPQERMKSCNAQANRTELKGETRREFMRDCLSG